MLKLTFLLFAVSALLVISECAVVPLTQTQKLGETRASILLKLSSQVLLLQSKTAIFGVEESVEILGNKNLVKKKESRAESSIETQLASLEKDVGAAIKSAKKSGKDISACIVTEETDRWIKADTKSLTQCENSISFTLIDLKLSELIAIPAGTATIVPICTLLHPFSNDNFKSCLQSEIDKLETKLSTIEENIKAELKTITAKAETCIQENLQSIQQEIKTISSDFSKCVKKAKKIKL